MRKMPRKSAKLPPKKSGPPEARAGDSESLPISRIFSVSGYSVVKKFRSGEDLIEFVKRIPEADLIPDIIVTDLRKRGKTEIIVGS